MISVPLVGCHSLELSFSPCFIRGIRRDVAGHVRLDFAIRNRSQMTAVGVYLDIPPVGISVRPAPGWQFAPSPTGNSGAIRVCSTPSLMIEPGHLSTACFLTLPVKKSYGGSIQIGGYEQSLAKVSDIRLFCTVGAVNFEPVRACLKLMALDVRALLATQFPHTETANTRRQLQPADWKLAIA